MHQSDAEEPPDEVSTDILRDILADGVSRFDISAAPVAVTTGAAESNEDTSGDGPHAADEFAPWQRELRRWLATLNPGRTQREYEKGVSYFFWTPGVPQSPAQLSFELLLAYRGALAMRATRHAEPRSRPRSSSGPRLAGGHRAELGIGGREEADNEDGIRGARYARRDGPLAPATVNLRLTALRQFLVHCALFGSLTQLSPDRIRAALPRLSIERRRPYQVLAEPEWDAFLEAARLPMRESVTPDKVAPADRDSVHPSNRAQDHATRSPWGVPRSVRRRMQAERDQSHDDAVNALRETTPRLPRSQAGLTGARTAQRDHALIALALATGLRAIELAELDVGDLSREWYAGREEWWLVLPDKKTKGQRGGRVLPLDAALVATLLAYIEATGRRWERAADRATPLFISGPAHRTDNARSKPKAEESDGGRQTRWTPGRLSPNSIRRIVDRVETQWLAQRTGEAYGEFDEEGGPGEARRISPHALRHSTAIALLEGNDVAGRPPASVEHVRGWLGHFDIRTTQGYLAHLEGRKHRRPYTLTPGATNGSTHPVHGQAAEPGGKRTTAVGTETEIRTRKEQAYREE